MIEFAQPGLLWALPAAGLPVLIHLLNRRRYRLVPWAAMAHLLEAEERRRQSVRFQNALVLLLRTLGVLLLVLLFARPAVSPALPGGGLRDGVHAFVLLDDSPSMARTTGGRSAFERACAFARSVAEGLSGRDAGMSVFLAGRPEPIFTAAPVRGEDVERLGRRLGDAVPSALAFRPAARLAALGEAAAREQDALFYVATDLQASDWGAGGPDSPAAQALAALRARGPVSLVDVGWGAEAGAGVVDVRDGGQPVYAGATTVFRAVLDNASGEARPAGTAHLSVDGTPLPPLAVPALPAGGRVELPLVLRLAEPGHHWLEVSLDEADGFAPDDRRAFAFEAVESLAVLVVEGGAAAEPSEASGYYLRAALDPSGRAGPGLRVELRRAELGLPEGLSRYAAVFVCGVRSPAGWREPLRRYAEGGGRVVLFVDDAADPAAWQAELLGAGGLAGCRLGEVIRAPEGRPFRLVGLDASDALLAPFAGWDGLFGMARFRAFRRIDLLEGLRALLRFDDPASSPALLVGEVGRGQVVLIPCTADDGWTDWPRSEAARVSYVALMHWLAEQGAMGRRRRGYALNLVGGDRIEYPLDPAQFRPEAMLRPPPGRAGLAPEAVRLRPVALEGREGLWFVSEPLAQAGVYELRLAGVDGGEASVYFAVNIPAAERTALRRSPESLGVAGVRMLTYAASGRPSALGSAGSRRLWPYVAAAVLLVLLLESVLAWRFGNPCGGGAP